MVLMVKKVNIEAKNLLAKLLASENIWIQHRRVETASFDMVKRILTFPMWKEMSDSVYTMLAGHEVSHALYSFDTVNGKRVNVVISIYAKRIDSNPDNLERAASYWNIVEDARIERLIKEPYPGLKGIFAEAYKELVDNDIFGVKNQVIETLPLIDRINVHFKAGHLFQLSFTDEEAALVSKVASTITMDDVVTVSKEIYEWSKKNELQPPPPITLKMSLEQLKELLENMPQEECDGSSPGGRGGQKIKIEITDAEGEEDGGDGDKDDLDDESCESGSKSGKKKSKGKSGKNSDGDDEDSTDDGKEKFDKGKGKGKKSDKKNDKGDKKDKGKNKDAKDGDKNSDGDDKEGDGGDKESGGEDKDGKDGDKDDKGKDKDGNGGDKDGKDGDKGGTGEDKGGTGEDKDGSEQADGKQVSDGRQATKPVDPGPPPAPTTQRTFDKKILSLRDPNAQEIVYVTLPKPNLKNIIVDFEKVHPSIRKHFTSSQIEVAEKEFVIFRESNMPKINYILQQFEMRKQADRYKRTRQHKTGALDTLRLCYYKTEEDLFKTIAICQDGKNHGLIFVVDWSGSMQSSMAGTIEQLILLCLFCRKAQIPFEVYSFTTGSTNAFSREPGNLIYAPNFSMRMYLSSRMSPGVFHDSCVNLFAMMPGGTFHGGPRSDNLIGCTPLNEAIITTIDLVKDFRQKTNAQIINAIFLTDGGANTVSEYYNENGQPTSMGGCGYSYNYGRLAAPATTRYLVDDRATHKVYEFTIGDMTPTMVRILRDRNNIHAVCFYIDGEWEYFFTSTIDDAKRADVGKQFNEDGYVVSTEWGFDEVYITKRGDVWRVKDVRLRPQKVEVGSPEYIKKLDENFVKQGQNMMKQRIMLDRFIKMIA